MGQRDVARAGKQSSELLWEPQDAGRPGEAPWSTNAYSVQVAGAALLNACDENGYPALREVRLPLLEMTLWMSPSDTAKLSCQIHFSVHEAGLLSLVALCSEGRGLPEPSPLLLSPSNKGIDL